MATKQTVSTNPLTTSDGGAAPVVAAEPSTSFEERTAGIVHPWAVGTSSDPRPEADESKIVGSHDMPDGTKDEGVGTPVGQISQPEGHENPAAVDPNLVGTGVVVDGGVSQEDQAKAQEDANADAAAPLDAKEETKRAKDTQKAQADGTVGEAGLPNNSPQHPSKVESDAKNDTKTNASA